MSLLNDAWNWVEDKVEDTVAFFRGVGEWLKEGILSLPLLFNSLMGKYFPNSTLGDAQFFSPSHSDPDVAALMSGSKWKDGLTITYSLPDSESDFYNGLNPSASGFERLSAQNEAAIHQVMTAVAGFVDRGIAYAGRDDAMIQVAGMRPGSVITDSHGYYPGMPLYGGETWLESGYSTSVPKGSHNYYLVLHELGHSLGLKHTHDSVRGLGSISTSLDSTEYTVMSYNNNANSSPQSFMQYDIAALQAMYGADFVTNSGNTTYTWSHTGEMFVNGAGQGQTLNTRIFLAIWDGGGADTYDMSNFAENALIDLTPGGFSRFSSGQLAYRYDGTKVNGNVYNAFQYKGDARSLIENAFGGGGNDKIIGNQANNVLKGGFGNDELHGGAGSDTLIGGEGDDRLFGGLGMDTLDGGVGWDTVSYWASAGAVRVYMHSVSANGGDAAGDSYMDIEVIDGTRFSDILEGNASGNAFWGDAGDDRMNGREGNDTLSGGDGNDILVGGAGGDQLNGGNGFDIASYADAKSRVYVDLSYPLFGAGDAIYDKFSSIEGLIGSAFNDELKGDAIGNRLYGETGQDILHGAEGSDMLFGGSDEDKLLGGTEADYLNGGDGSDILNGGSGADRLEGGDGFDLADYSEANSRVIVDRANMARNTGDAAGDVYGSIEGVQGSAHDDELYGSAGRDIFYGGTGIDMLEGRGGGDQLDGGAGFDFAVYWSSYGVRASLLNSQLNTGDALGDGYTSIEGLQGSSFYADWLQGDGTANTLYGYGGNDELLGEGGNDYIEGGNGSDTIAGGEGLDWLLGNAGRDYFRFDTAIHAGNVDTLADFSWAEDLIQLSRSWFNVAGTTYSSGPTYLDAAAFTIGTAATTTSHRIIYNKTSGELFYDADGLGWAAGQVKFASIGAGHSLTNYHFLLV